VIAESSSEETIEETTELHPDLVLLDVNIPAEMAWRSREF